jgi:preprotein translocase subunit SecE
MEQNVNSKKKDVLLWTLVVFLFLVGFSANYYFADIALPVRLAGWVLLVFITVIIIFQTKVGRKIWSFALDARMELRKVVWPTRQETTHITMIIAALVVLVAMIIWGIDSLLLWAIGWLNS